jgi:hypothetical protein
MGGYSYRLCDFFKDRLVATDGGSAEPDIPLIADAFVHLPYCIVRAVYEYLQGAYL